MAEEVAMAFDRADTNLNFLDLKKITPKRNFRFCQSVHQNHQEMCSQDYNVFFLHQHH